MIGDGCNIGPLTQIEDSEIGANCRVNSSYLRGYDSSRMSIGPFANLQHGEIIYANANTAKKYPED